MPLLIFLIVTCLLVPYRTEVDGRYLPTRSDTDKVAELRGLIAQILESSNESTNNGDLRPKTQYNKSSRSNILNRWSAMVGGRGSNSGGNNGSYDNDDVDIAQIIAPITKQYHTNNRNSGNANNINSDGGLFSNPTNYPKSLRMILGQNGIYDNDRSLNFN